MSMFCEERYDYTLVLENNIPHFHIVIIGRGDVFRE